jgi:hypothetical protein
MLTDEFKVFDALNTIPLEALNNFFTFERAEQA